MQPSKQPMLWNSYIAQPEPNVGYFTHNYPGSPNRHYSTAEPIDDQDEFFIGSSYYSVRVEQAANDPGYCMANLTTSEMDDTMLHMIDGGLDDEESTNINHLPGDAGTHPSDYHVQQLELEVAMLRRENRELRLRTETFEMRQHPTDSDLNPDTDIEEVIEEEHRTVHRTHPALELYNQSVQCGVPSDPKDVGVGSWDVRRYRLIDLYSDKIDRSHFPPEYWSRLEQTFKAATPLPPSTRDVALQCSTDCRTTATMAIPLVVKERLCFGVTVRPVTQDVGVSCSYPSTREFGCTTVETEAMLRDWVDRKLGDLSEPTRNIVTQIMKSSTSTREEFAETILRVLKKDSKNVTVQVTPDNRSQFTATLDENAIVSPVKTIASYSPTRPAVKMESQIVEARPSLMNKSVMTMRVVGAHVATETEGPLLRSQSSQAAPEIPDVTGCGVQTDSWSELIDVSVQAIAPGWTQPADLPVEEAKIRDSTSTKPISVSADMDKTSLQNEIPHASSADSFPQNVYESGSPVAKPRASSYGASGFAANRPANMREKITTTGSSFSHSIHLRSSRPMSPSELRQMFPAYFASGSSVPPTPPESTSAEQTESAADVSVGRSGTVPQSEKYSVATERRVVDEQSQRHLLPPGTDLDKLTRGGSAAIEDALARSRELGTTHVVREFQPVIEVLHHIPEQDRGLPASTAAQSAPPALKKVFNIPVLHSVRSAAPITSPEALQMASDESRLTDISDARTHVLDSSVFVTRPTGTLEHTTSTLDESHTMHHSTRQGSDTDVLRMPGSSVYIHSIRPRSMTEPGNTQAHETKSSASQLPRRNNSYVMSREATKACEKLLSHYRSGQNLIQEPSMERELSKLIDIWFELSSSSSLSLVQLEDFLAILSEYHENLARDVLQSTNEQGLTSLHLAVGHGAWPVVNLILDSGYAEPDRLNRAGYSPIMISTFGTIPCPSALATLNRLFSLGDVNLRSASGTGQTPLMLAAQNHSLEVLELLLQHNALVNLQDRTGNTALMFAIHQSDRDIVLALLDRPELDLSLRDNCGDDALAIAARQTDPVIGEWIRSVLKRTSRGPMDSDGFASTAKTGERRRVREVLRQLCTAHRNTHFEQMHSSKQSKCLTRIAFV